MCFVGDVCCVGDGTGCVKISTRVVFLQQSCGCCVGGRKGEKECEAAEGVEEKRKRKDSREKCEKFMCKWARTEVASVVGGRGLVVARQKAQLRKEQDAPSTSGANIARAC